MFWREFITRNRKIIQGFVFYQVSFELFWSKSTSIHLFIWLQLFIIGGATITRVPRHQVLEPFFMRML